MAIAQIGEWLQTGQPYETGVSLFREHSSNKALLIIFEGGENAFSTRKLYAELERIFAAADVKPQKSAKSPSPELPQDLQQLQRKSMDGYKNMAALHQQLENEMTEEERLALALQILDTDQQVQEGFHAVDHYREQGERIKSSEPRTKRGKDVKKMNQAELAMALKNIPTYITKVKKRIEEGNLKPGRLEKLQHQLADYERDLAFVKSKLKTA